MGGITVFEKSEKELQQKPVRTGAKSCTCKIEDSDKTV